MLTELELLLSPSPRPLQGESKHTMLCGATQHAPLLHCFLFLEKDLFMYIYVHVVV